jgi:hypothetical protein
LVGKEFNDGVIEGLFASTPPLEALRLLVSDAATICEGQDKVLMINDISRAYFEAPMRRFLCVELPDEARDQKDYEEDNVGLLLMSLYGTRDAAANFQAEVNVFMKSCGFRRGRYNVSTYYHQEKNLKTLVHGDDFVTTGERKNTEWFRARLLSRFQIKTKVVGTGTSDLREATVLNRTIRTTATGWEYEADQRHADILVREMNLEEANSVKTPGEDAKPWWEDEDAEKLKGKEETKFRAMAARCNYLALDRADIQYPTKEICRGMANPSKGDVRKLRRLVRYLVERRRVVFVFEFQKYVSDLKGYSDSDWAGCRRTAKSTSGGVIMNGKHCIKTWASTQKNITLSSGEAELVAAVKMSTEIIGMLQLAKDWGMEKVGEVLVDSSAALGIVHRQGCGKMRHVKVGALWIQQKSEQGELAYNKVLGLDNPSDLMTKHLGRNVIDKHMEAIRQVQRSGRASTGLTI